MLDQSMPLFFVQIIAGHYLPSTSRNWHLTHKMRSASTGDRRAGARFAGGAEWCLPLCCVVFGGKTTAVEGVPAAVTVLVCLSRGARLHISSVNGECGGACRRYRANL